MAIAPSPLQGIDQPANIGSMHALQGQVDPLKEGSVANAALPGFAELNIRPKSIEQIVPAYISR
jgi:hypothetical protein